MTEKYLQTNRAAEEYGLSQSYLAKLRHYGSGPPFLKVGRRVLYMRSKFEEWLENHEQISTSSQNALAK